MGEVVIVAYTDGACSGNPGPAGLGVVLTVDDTRYELSEYLGEGTNNIAELSAILRALQAIQKILDKGSKARKLSVYTDSQYAIGILTKHWKAKANVELVAQIKTVLATLPPIKFYYVKAHNGDELNERADALAVEAVKTRSTHKRKVVI